MVARKNSSVLKKFSRFENNMRSRFFGFPFAAISAMTRWEIYGKENLMEVVEERKFDPKGIITVSNHVSLFDDPIIIVALMNIQNFSDKTKCWYSTACANNFNPVGKNFSSKFIRYFSRVANMIFLSRAKKRGGAPPVILDDPLEYLSEYIDSEGMRVLQMKAHREGMDVSSYLKSFYTTGPDGYNGRNASFNQIGMIESVARVNAGQWVHLFPEGSRSRTIHLKMPKAGVGKVIYHSRGSTVLPICVYGMQDVLPVGSLVPRFFKKVIINVGKPISESDLDEHRRRTAGTETYGDISNLAMREIALLRPFVLQRYLGEEKASTVLLEEAQLARALKSIDAPASSKDAFVEPYAEPYEDRKSEEEYGHLPSFAPQRLRIRS